MLHIIPDTWSHLHMLVSVFPLVGLLFVVGFYVAAIVTNNDRQKRTCLLAIGLIALLGIPTYMSGDGSATMLPAERMISEDRIFYHFGWGWAALSLLFLTGIVSWIELFRSSGSGRPSNNAVHLVLGLSLLTLAFMALVGELGWEINHPELHLGEPTPGASAGLPSGSDVAEGQATPQLWSHVHMILNHFPT